MTAEPKILIVDDDPSILKVIEMRLVSNGYSVSAVTDPEKAVTLMKENTFSMALLDLKLAGKDGIELMVKLHELYPQLPVIILTAHGTINSAVEAMKRGAHGYLTKPFDYNELLLQVKNCLETSQLTEEVNRLRKLVDEQYGIRNIIGKSSAMKKVLAQVRQAADVDTNVYINGESGTGKELIAKKLHILSSRSNEPFVALNCAAIPETLLESELFGYEKGAFTGASKNKKGFFQQAHGGTLFLDEISEMPISMQSKLLRVLEEREFYPLGSSRSVKVDVRIIVASNRDLEKEVAENRFREDLFYRIHVIVIKLPPLKERLEDIPLLAWHFLERYRDIMKKDIKGLTHDAIRKLMDHNWPGNVRELENTIESAVALSTSEIIDEDMVLPESRSTDSSFRPLKAAKEDFERRYLIELVEMTKGNISQAAKLAGKYRADLYELLRKHDLDASDFRE